MRRSLAIVAALAVGLLVPSARAARPKVERRCGWFENPTPANAWLTDRDRAWTIAIQGGYEAEGDWPTFTEARWVHTNGASYGYGCACLDATFDRASGRVVRIAHARARSLAVCRADRKLREPG